MRATGFDAVYALDAVAPWEVWDIVAVLLRESEVALQGLELNGRSVAGQTLVRNMRRQGMTGCDVKSTHLHFLLGFVTPFDHTFMMLRQLEPFVWDWDVLGRRLSELPDFISGWVFDSEYEEWQNERDPEAYRDEGRRGELQRRLRTLLFP